MSYQDVFGQVLPAVDAAVLCHELLQGDLLPDVGVVERRVEHDDGEGEDVAGVWLVKQFRVLITVARGEGLHDAVDLHGLARKSAKIMIN